MTAGAQLVRRMQRVHVPAGGELPPPLGPVSSHVIVLLRGTVHLHSSAAHAEDGGSRSRGGVHDGKARGGPVSSSASGQGDAALSRSGINFGNASKTGPRGCAQDSLPANGKGCSTGGGCAVSDSDVTCEAAGGPESSPASGKDGSGFSASGINFGGGSEVGLAGDGQDLGPDGKSAACSIVTAARVGEPVACEGPCLLSGAPMAEGAEGPAEAVEVCVVAATPAECWLLGAQAVRQVWNTLGKLLCHMI